MRSHNYTPKEKHGIYRDFKDAYMTGYAGKWFLDLFRDHGYVCPLSLNTLIFNALREKSIAHKISHTIYPDYLQHPCYQEYI